VVSFYLHLRLTASKQDLFKVFFEEALESGCVFVVTAI